LKIYLRNNILQLFHTKEKLTKKECEVLGL